MTALLAAQVEDRAVRVDRGGRHDEVVLAPGVLDVLDDVAVGLHVEGIEELAPPLLREMRLEIGDGAQARAGRRAPRPLHLRSYCHDGRKFLSMPPDRRRGRALETPVSRPYGQAMKRGPYGLSVTLLSGLQDQCK